MNDSRRTPPFSFAEIMIAAPWAYHIIGNPTDNDRADMLHRNSDLDEWSRAPSGIDTLALEREARQARAQYLVGAFRRLRARLSAAARGLGFTRPIAKA